MTDFASQNRATMNAKIANDNARVADENNRRARQYARERNDALDDLDRYINLVNANAEAISIASKGITASGYTNNLAMELRMLRHRLVKEMVSNPGPNTSLAMPFGDPGQRGRDIKKLTQNQRKHINLRLLCRAEWFDWGMHGDVLSKANSLVVHAMMNPTVHNAHLRNPEYINALTEETDQYHRLKAAALNEETGYEAREKFEQERFDFWKDVVRFKVLDDDGRPVPSIKLTKNAEPHITPDFHLPAGRLCRRFGFNIETGKKSQCYRDSLASAQCAGYNELHGSAFYI